jgi:hypothetical protein
MCRISLEVLEKARRQFQAKEIAAWGQSKVGSVQRMAVVPVVEM